MTYALSHKGKKITSANSNRWCHRQLCWRFKCLKWWDIIQQIQETLIHQCWKGTTCTENSRCVSLFSRWGVRPRTGPAYYTYYSTDDHTVGEKYVNMEMLPCGAFSISCHSPFFSFLQFSFPAGVCMHVCTRVARDCLDFKGWKVSEVLFLPGSGLVTSYFLLLGIIAFSLSLARPHIATKEDLRSSLKLRCTDPYQGIVKDHWQLSLSWHNFLGILMAFSMVKIFDVYIVIWGFKSPVIQSWICSFLQIYFAFILQSNPAIYSWWSSALCMSCTWHQMHILVIAFITEYWSILNACVYTYLLPLCRYLLFYSFLYPHCLAQCSIHIGVKFNLFPITWRDEVQIL